jgi:hypothetical protein
MWFLNFLNRLFGTLLGPILFPIKSLLVNSLVFAGGLLVAAGALVVLPIVAMFYAKSLIGAVFNFVVAAFALAIVVPIVASVLGINQLISTISDSLSALSFGLSEGYRHGLTSVLSQFIFRFSPFSTNFQRIIGRLNRLGRNDTGNATILPEYTPSTFDDPEAANENDYGDQENEDTFHVVSLDDEPAPEQKPVASTSAPVTPFKFLTEKELANATGIESIKLVLNQYENLKQRLDALDEGIAAGYDEQGDIKGIEDEIVSLNGVKTPALSYKEYLIGQDSTGQEVWRVVPSTTKITDKDFFESWASNNSRHPLTLDDLNTPAKYKELPTRYCLVKYEKQEDCWELLEAATTIRQKLADLNLDTINVSDVISGLGRLIGQTFFSSPGTSNPQQSTEETSLLGGSHTPG